MKNISKFKSNVIILIAGACFGISMPGLTQTAAHPVIGTGTIIGIKTAETHRVGMAKVADKFKINAIKLANKLASEEYVKMCNSIKGHTPEFCKAKAKAAQCLAESSDAIFGQSVGHGFVEVDPLTVDTSLSGILSGIERDATFSD